MTKIIWQQVPANALTHDSALQETWNGLSAQRMDLPFMRAEVIATALATLGAGRESLFIGRRQADVVAMFVLTPVGRLQWSTFQPSQLPLGPWVAAADLDLQALCRALVRGPLSPCLALSITQIDPLVASRAADAEDNAQLDYIETAWLEIAGSFDDYWAARGKNLRQNMRTQRNKLSAEHVATHMRVLRAPGDMASAIARFGALETAGWKGAEGTAVHADNEQGRFYTRLFEDAAGRGEALVFEYLFDDRCAAMDLCLLRAGTLALLKTTYDESVGKGLSPAALLREDELKVLFDGNDNVRRLEYYGRRRDWQIKLTDRARTIYHLTTYRWPLVKRLATRRRQAPASAKPAEP